MCRNKKHTRHWSDFGIVCGQLLSRKLHSKVSIFLPPGFHLSQTSQNAIHMVEHVIMDSDNMMQCDRMCFRHPQSPVSEWHEQFHEVLEDCPFIHCCVESPVFAVFWILQTLAGEFSQSIGWFKQLQCRIPPCFHIDIKKDCDLYFGFLTVNKLVSTTWCQRNHHSWHSLLYDS